MGESLWVLEPAVLNIFQVELWYRNVHDGLFGEGKKKREREIGF